MAAILLTFGDTHGNATTLPGPTNQIRFWGWIAWWTPAGLESPGEVCISTDSRNDTYRTGFQCEWNVKESQSCWNVPVLFFFFFWQVTLFVSLLIRWAIPLTLHDFRLWVDLTTTATTGFNPRVFLAPACRWQDSPRTAQSWEMQRPQVTETYWHMQLMLLRCYLFSSHPWQPEPPPTLSAPGACSCRGSTRCGRLRVFVPVHGHLVLATLGYPWQLVLKGSFLSLLLISCHLIFALASEMGETCSGCRDRFYTRSETFSGHSWCFWRMLFRLQHWNVL